MNLIKTIKKIPGVRSAYRLFCNTMKRHRLIFTDIFRNNKWHGTDSVSGTGSTKTQTSVIIRELPILFSELGISTVLDIPCGDFNWMREVNLNGMTYLGTDIVKGIIKGNKKYEKQNVHFKVLSLLKDVLPKVDIILCRDCLVHFSYKDIFTAINNICRNDSKYLLTTTFPLRIANRDITTGEWRVINLCASPFNFPVPLRIINEHCTEGNGIYSDKSLALWRINDIRHMLFLKTR